MRDNRAIRSTQPAAMMNTSYRKLLPGTALDYFDAREAVEALKPGAWAELPYTARVHAENIVRKAEPTRINDYLTQLIKRRRDLVPNLVAAVGGGRVDAEEVVDREQAVVDAAVDRAAAPVLEGRAQPGRPAERPVAVDPEGWVERSGPPAVVEEPA